MCVECHYQKDLTMAGSDDSLLHITTDGGKKWENITPKGMPEWMMFNSIEFDPFVKGGAYVAGTRYKSGDYQPYLYKTKDYGKTWTKITDGIDASHFTRVVRTDPKRAGLLYAGTEFGMYISFDDGASWKPFQLNLPVVPITDLTIKNDNLIAATQGRSFWLIDDLTPLHQLSDGISASSVHLYKPMPSYRMNGGQAKTESKTEGKNHPNGVMIHYFLKDTTKAKVTLEILETDGKLIKKFSTKPDKKLKEEQMKMKPGMNRQIWNMRYADAEGFDGLIMWGASLTGPKAIPGVYKARLTVSGPVNGGPIQISLSHGGENSQVSTNKETEFEILKDPRTSGTQADMKAQFDFSIAVRDKLTETNKAVKNIRTVREQINRVIDPMKDKAELKDVTEMGKAINEEMKKIEEALYQTKNKSNQDPLNYPIRLNNKLGALAGEVDGSDYKPTEQVKTVYKEITDKIDVQLNSLKQIMKDKLPKFNDLVKQKQVSAVVVDDVM